MRRQRGLGSRQWPTSRVFPTFKVAISVVGIDGKRPSVRPGPLVTSR